MSNTPQIDAFIKKMKTPAYAKTSLEFRYGRLMGRALRIECELTKIKAQYAELAKECEENEIVDVRSNYETE